MNSRVVAVFAKFLSWVNTYFEESLFGKMFNKICACIAKVFSGSFICRFFSDKQKTENVWDNSVFGKIVNLDKRLILFLQKKLSPFINYQIKNSALCSAFSKWNTVSVRIYGLFLIVFCIATTFLRDNSKLTLAILLFGQITGLFLVLVNKSIKQLVSGSKILNAIGEIFIEYNVRDSQLSRVKMHHYIIACVIALIMSVACVYTDVYTLILVTGAILAFAFILRYLSLGVFLTVAFSPILPTMVLVGLSFMCAFVFLMHAISDKNFKFATAPFNVTVVFFVVALLLGVVNSFAFASSLKQVLVHGSFILFYFVAINVIRTKKQWSAIVKVFIFSAFIVALYGLFQNFFEVSSTESWIDEEMFENIKVRVYSFFDNPNVLGEFLVLTIPVAVALLWSKVKDAHKLLFAVVLLCMAGCMIFTWSRGAWLGMLLAVALFLMIYDRRWILAGILMLALLPIALYITGNMAIIERFISIGNTQDTSTAYRVSIWNASVNMISDFWVGGIGIGSDAYTTIYPTYALPGARFALHSHNLYLQFFVETGIVGIISLVSLLLGFLKTVFNKSVVKKIKTSNTAKIVVALGAGFLGFMFQGLTDYVWYNYRILMIFWIVIALGVSGVNILKAETKEGEIL